MHVIFSVRGNIKIDDQIDRRDVQPARSNIRGHQNGPVFRAKFVQCRKSLWLRHAAVDTDCAKAKITQHIREPLRARLRVRKDHDGISSKFVAEKYQIYLLVLCWNKNVVLDERVHSCILGRHFYFDRTPKRSALKLVHLRGHRGREQQRLSLARKHSEDLVQLALKVQVEQAISLIQYQKLHAFQRKAARIFHVVDESTRRCNNNVRTFRERYALRHHVNTSRYCDTPCAE
mmetsp:Transcript_11136/g.29918  ORF Transcript_11136/g.29918 Transcript_11136/m.29918 type:complete len:232 (-) Transcript_11136:393-1088(-)